MSILFYLKASMFRIQSHKVLHNQESKKQPVNRQSKCLLTNTMKLNVHIGKCANCFRPEFELILTF